jgi:hypothetical protein
LASIKRREGSSTDGHLQGRLWLQIAKSIEKENLSADMSKQNHLAANKERKQCLSSFVSRHVDERAISGSSGEAHRQGDGENESVKKHAAEVARLDAPPSALQVLGSFPLQMSIAINNLK